MTEFDKLKQFVTRQYVPPIVLCIGTTRVPGDSFGPITGQILTDYFRVPTEIYGTVKNPVHALNLTQTITKIRLLHPDRKIIAVDSALCAGGRKGIVKTFPGPLRPGLATGKNLIPVGDFSVTATVGTGSENDLFSVGREYVALLSCKAATLIRRAFGYGKSRTADAELF